MSQEWHGGTERVEIPVELFLNFLYNLLIDNWVVSFCSICQIDRFDKWGSTCQGNLMNYGNHSAKMDLYAIFKP